VVMAVGVDGDFLLPTFIRAEYSYKETGLKTKPDREGNPELVLVGHCGLRRVL